ncbi:MAG TPA: hypothetical protein VFU36_10405 [Jatrophihabitans sp.]|nr:hypothetical protein [Jatrophihabitans sp.]
MSIASLESHQQARASLAKVRRADVHIAAINTIIENWLPTVGQPVAAIANDRLSWDVRLSLSTPASLESLSLTFGDAIHNLRSALDHLVWSYASPDQLDDEARRQLAFPASQTEQSWNQNHGRWLRSVPLDVVARIKDCQPYNRPVGVRASDALLGLNALDNQDKHRLLVEAQAALTDMGVAHSVEFASEEAAERNVPPDVTVHQAKLEDKALLLEGRTVDRIEKISGNIQVEYQFLVITPRGPAELLDVLAGMRHYVLLLLAYVCDVGPSTA